jgi:hypothetical protein
MRSIAVLALTGAIYYAASSSNESVPKVTETTFSKPISDDETLSATSLPDSL